MDLRTPLRALLRTSALLPMTLAAPAAAQLPSALFGASEHADFGSVVERIGDVNSDGVRDFAVGAPLSDEIILLGTLEIPVDNAGAVTVYSGVDGSLLWKVTGSISGNTGFGSAIADAGDVDFDGRDDVLVGIPEANGLSVGSGKVELRSGFDGSWIRTFFGSQTDERYGESLAVGHLDGDPTSPEAAIGAPHHDMDDSTGGPLQEGRVEIVDLSTGAVMTELEGGSYFVDVGPFTDELVRRGWGTQIEYLGDVDGDGYGTLAISAPYTDYIDDGVAGTTVLPLIGVVMVSETLHPQPQAPSWLTGATNDLLGVRMKALPDSSPGSEANWAVYASGTNRLHLYSGPNWMNTIQDSVAEGLDCIAPIGDVDQDGKGDIAVGVPGLSSQTGRVAVFSAADGTLLETLQGPAPGDRFGSAVAGADMNGDNAVEIWIGAPEDDTAFNGGGAVHLESVFTCDQLATWQMYGAGTPGTLGVPTLGCLTDPVLGEQLLLFAGSVTTTETIGLVGLGLQPTQIPILGGTLLTLPFQVFAIGLPQAGTTIPLDVPFNANFCGVNVYAQVIQQNEDAPEGWAFSPGVQLTLGS